METTARPAGEGSTDAGTQHSASILELATRTFGLFLGLAYAAGFLVIAINQARYGIVEFNPIRARIFTAGILFLLLAAIPVVTVTRVFGIFGMTSRYGIRLSSKPEYSAYLNVTLAAAFYIVAHYLSWSLSFLFPGVVGFGTARAPASWLLGGLIFISVFAGLELGKRFDDFPRRFAILSVLVTTGFFVVGLLYMSRPSFWLTLWFYSAGIVGAVVLSWAHEPRRIATYPWERVALAPLFLFLVVFAIEIYGNVSATYGGGAPVPAKVHLAGDAVVAGEKVLDALLIDETDHGYYILVKGRTDTAYFLRRDLVTLIEFGGKGAGQSPDKH